MTGARLLGAVLPLLALAALLLWAAHAATHRVRRPMTHLTPAPPHRAVIEAALTDWWTTTDPAEPFHTPAVAAQVEMYLLSSGYTITPDTRRNLAMPSRSAIVTALVLAAVCAISAVFALVRGDWEWAGMGVLGACLLAYEGIRDLQDRRAARSAR
ncbi:hypothetical protein ACIGMX_12625 [Streptomyces aquilus]|uniref:hypothetical protein n=1 Tax=Streptomyces aquilus TaxID=2548456 RepID=UPI0037CE93D5